MDETMNATIVTFPSGSVHEVATITAVLQLDAGLVVITDRSPFHPLDHKWPDQPADKGWMELSTGGRKIPVCDCITIAQREGEQAYYCGEEIPAKRGEEGWAYFCGHVLEEEVRLDVGSEVSLSVDRTFRDSLNASHTGSHLAALAVNSVLKDFWTKEIAADALGHQTLINWPFKFPKFARGHA